MPGETSDDRHPSPQFKVTEATEALPDQRQLLSNVEPDYLIVMDACRADVFQDVCSRGATIVRSPASATFSWVGAVHEIIEGWDPLYFNANPLVTWMQEEKQMHEFNLIDCFQWAWGEFTDEEITTIHPEAMNGIVLSWVRQRREKRPAVIHYMQPHHPHIGDPPLKGRVQFGINHWGDLAQKAYSACMPAKRVKAGELTWDDVRRSYRANAKLIWNSVKNILRHLTGRIVITSDHGDLLGEDGKFGHEPWWREYNALRRVPWILVEKENTEEHTTRERLQFMGYV